MLELIEQLTRLGSPRVLLIGDFLLDAYVYGHVERISPEAPVPVLNVLRREEIAGGAGNVAAAAAALGARVTCVGVIGQDLAGGRLDELLTGMGADTTRLLRLTDRPTAVKTRYVGLAQHRHAQQMLRVDEEHLHDLSADAQDRLVRAAADAAADADVVVLEDYNKGVCRGELGRRLIEASRAAGQCVVVDPALLHDFTRYRGATLLKPNRFEASRASGVDIHDNATLQQASERLLEQADAQAVVISLDREGAYFCRRGQAGKRIPHQRPRNVYDVTGAGDETVAVLAVAIAGGCSYEQAEELANVAGGLEVEKFGFVPITRQEIADELRRMQGLRGGKVLPRTSLVGELARRRQRGEVIVFTNGCFDLLHTGHVRYLQQSREQGNCLIVAINSDASVRRLKGPTRPVVGERERAEMLAALECVDYVTIFDEDTPLELLDLLRPDILVKGGTTPEIVGRDLVERYGGKVCTMALVDGQSTTQIITKIVEQTK
ncbi:MAG: D-glycero-beta-D-manno-heptose 1-phosphate adenylyltransferase [Phycisphaerae bacterium]|nr:D-glycero-beta-D-manno-heptose 1-phosphate adenylyltransferase [Phycisphaerae bacterium]